MNANELEIDLIGRLLKANDSATDAALERRFKADPALIAKSNRLRDALVPLAADKAPIPVPADLDLRTIGFVACHMANANAEDYSSNVVLADDHPRRSGLPTSLIFSAQSLTSSSSLNRRTWFAGIGLSVAFMLVLLPAVVAVRRQAQIHACQNNLRGMHQAMVGFTQTHDREFPLMEPDKPQTNVITQLRAASMVPAAYKPVCNTANKSGGYGFALGYEENGLVSALRNEPEFNGVPLAADLCGPNNGSFVNHQHGANVLFVDGSVRFCSTPRVGVDADHIYMNWKGEVKLGLGKYDSVVAAAEDEP